MIDFCRVAKGRDSSDDLSPFSLISMTNYLSLILLVSLSTSIYSIIVGAKVAAVYDDAPGERDACGLSLPWQCIILKKTNASY